VRHWSFYGWFARPVDRRRRHLCQCPRRSRKSATIRMGRSCYERAGRCRIPK
ncbi:hypothetical protein FRC17_008830, partial [Serendipita sp. 399]